MKDGKKDAATLRELRAALDRLPPRPTPTPEDEAAVESLGRRIAAGLRRDAMAAKDWLDSLDLRPLPDRLRDALAPPAPVEDAPALTAQDRRNDAAREWTRADPRRAGAVLRAAFDPDRLRRWAAKTGDRAAGLRAIAAGLGYATDEPEADRARKVRAALDGFRETLGREGMDGLPVTLWLYLAETLLPDLARAEYLDGESALAALVRIVRPFHAEPITAREIETVEPKRGRPLSRLPALLDAGLAAPLVAGEIEAVVVDGEEVATPAPTALPLDDSDRRRRQYRIADPDPGRRTLWPLPRRIGSTETRDLTLLYLSGLPLSRDERKDGLLRADAYWIAALSFAVAGPVELTPAEAAALLTGEPCRGAPSDSVIRRFYAAATLIGNAVVVVNPRTGERRRLALTDFGPDGRTVIGPPTWWKGRGDRWRLTGSLYRRARTSTPSGRGRTTSPREFVDWGATSRFLSGAEAALSFSRTPGAGRSKRTPNLLRPASGATGAGEPVFIPRADVLRLAGEHLPADAEDSPAARRRYERRIAALEAAGYFVPRRPTHAAPAGDSIEIVKRTGSKTAAPGIWIRASARFVEAQKLAGLARGRGFDRRPLSALLPGPTDD